MNDIYFIHVFNIVWDTYDEDSDKTLDPKELGLPSEVVICDLTEEEYNDLIDDVTGIADYISDRYGYCISGFGWEKFTGDNPRVKEIMEQVGEKHII